MQPDLFSFRFKLIKAPLSHRSAGQCIPRARLEMTSLRLYIYQVSGGSFGLSAAQQVRITSGHVSGTETQLVLRWLRRSLHLARSSFDLIRPQHRWNNLIFISISHFYYVDGKGNCVVWVDVRLQNSVLVYPRSSPLVGRIFTIKRGLLSSFHMYVF